MDDRRLDELLSDAARTYRVPPAAPLEAMWGAIERAAFTQAPATRRAPTWRTVGAGMAAALVLGVGAGRLSVRTPVPQPVAPQVATAVASPEERTAEDVLGRTAVLLSAVRATGKTHDNARLAEQASQLLGTTRLLLDSPVGSDARLRSLLQDLELVLAQVARLEPDRSRNELPIISAAVEQRDLVPRIRTAVVELSIGGF